LHAGPGHPTPHHSRIWTVDQNLAAFAAIVERPRGGCHEPERSQKTLREVYLAWGLIFFSYLFFFLSLKFERFCGTYSLLAFSPPVRSTSPGPSTTEVVAGPLPAPYRPALSLLSVDKYHLPTQACMRALYAGHERKVYEIFSSFPD
jgi:hypothetical protein